MGAYAKSGSSPISGIVKPGTVPPRGGLYLMDVVPDGEVRYGFPNISDTAEIVELIASGSHMTLFVTGRGSVVGSAIAPVIKVCANPDTYRRMEDDMDLNAGRVIDGVPMAEVADELLDLMIAVASGQPIPKFLRNAEPARPMQGPIHGDGRLATHPGTMPRRSQL